MESNNARGRFGNMASSSFGIRKKVFITGHTDLKALGLNFS